jgi:hypothetical protein
VHDAHADFARHLVSEPRELTFEGLHIEVLERAEAQRVVHVEEDPDHASGQSFLSIRMNLRLWGLPERLSSGRA